MSTVGAPSVAGPRRRHRSTIPRGAVGNLLAVIALISLAVALALCQVESWQFPARRTSTLLAAASVIAAYVGLVGLVARARLHSAAATPTVAALSVGTLNSDWLVVYASQFGQAEQLAGRTAMELKQAGSSVELMDITNLSLELLQNAQQVLFIVSTTGEGDAPDPAVNFIRNCISATGVRLEHLRYGLLALGDRDYEQFCAFGYQLDGWLRRSGAEPLFDLITVDDGDPLAVRRWQTLVAALHGAVERLDWLPPAYGRWTLERRRHLNQCSPGLPVYDLHLTPTQPGDLCWQAGDIAEIGPRNAPAVVQAWLRTTGLSGDAVVAGDNGNGGSSLTLSALVAVSRLPPLDVGRGMTAQQAADALVPLPHRAYSIASVPAEGCLRLLVRQIPHDSGELGLGSGWLTRYADCPGPVDVRIRRNPTFHAPVDARPLVLIGNGTGIAGLRALLQDRISRGHHANWLLYGERSSVYDRHYGKDIDTWQRAGLVKRVDLAFSRDQTARRYVQELVQENSAVLREWLNQGAAVYVCGSLQGMAPAVDAALAGIVGRGALEAMARDGRYRRDVY